MVETIPEEVYKELFNIEEKLTDIDNIVKKEGVPIEPPTSAEIGLFAHATSDCDLIGAVRTYALIKHALYAIDAHLADLRRTEERIKAAKTINDIAIGLDRILRTVMVTKCRCEIKR